MVEYEVLVDGATLHHFLTEAFGADGKPIEGKEVVRSVIHQAGDIVTDDGEDRLALHVVQAVKDGDPHVTSLLVKKKSGNKFSAKEEE